MVTSDGLYLTRWIHTSGSKRVKAIQVCHPYPYFINSGSNACTFILNILSIKKLNLLTCNETGLRLMILDSVETDLANNYHCIPEKKREKKKRDFFLQFFSDKSDFPPAAILHLIRLNMLITPRASVKALKCDTGTRSL